MEIYKPSRRQNRRRLLILLIIYFIVVILRLLSNYFIAFVFETNVSTGKEYFAVDSKQLVLVATYLLKFRIQKKGLSLYNHELSVNDLVLVDNNNFINFESKEIYFDTLLNKIKNALSLGIIKLNPNYSIQKVVAVPGDTVVYTNLNIISINGRVDNNIKEDSIPLLDYRKTVKLTTDQYFLTGPIKYSMDDKISGPSNSKKIKGKIILLLGKNWKWL